MSKVMVIRTIIYEGPPEWVSGCIARETLVDGEHRMGPGKRILCAHSAPASMGKRTVGRCPDSPTGRHEFEVDIEYDHTGKTINCVHCGAMEP